MCRAFSFFHRPDNGDIVVYDITSHSGTSDHLKLNLKLWREGHWIPQTDELECRILADDHATSVECAERMRTRFASVWDFYAWAASQEVISSNNLDLRGCDLSKVKAWPKSIGGSLDLSGCDLSKVKAWPKSIGGGLDLSGCDLSKVKAWPKSIGGSLDLSGCDLSKVKVNIPKNIRVIK